MLTAPPWVICGLVYSRNKSYVKLKPIAVMNILYFSSPKALWDQCENSYEVFISFHTHTPNWLRINPEGVGTSLAQIWALSMVLCSINRVGLTHRQNKYPPVRGHWRGTGKLRYVPTEVVCYSWGREFHHKTAFQCRMTWEYISCFWGKPGKNLTEGGRKAGVEAETGRKWPGSWVISSPLQNEVLRS